MDTLQVEVRREVFEKLQKLAIPLVDDTSSVIDRLIKHWETSKPKSVVAAVGPPVAAASQQIWRSARGEPFPVGLELRAGYLGKTYSATVTTPGIEFNGKLYDSPSSAGIAVKESAGTSGLAASTNGWDFWQMLDPETNRWVSIDVLRSKATA